MEYNKQLLHRFMTEKVTIHVKTQDEYNRFMKLLEKETGLIWWTGLKPTEHDYWNFNGRNTVIYDDDGLAFGNIQNVNGHEYTVIELSDLIKEEKNMKFKVGDKVRIRSWESMEKEFGLNWRGDINCPVLFLKGMKEYCGTIQTITAISQGAYYIGNTNYFFDRKAVEPIKQETKGEHFRKEIKKIRNEYPDYDHIAVVNDKPVPCRNTKCKSCLFYKTYGDNPVIGVCTITEGFKKWCAEPYKAPEEQPKPAKSILDKAEHDYLAAVIAPKRIYKNVKSITKSSSVCLGSYYIHIKLSYGECLNLPYFNEKDHMYDGMEADRPYTLEELGLKKEDEKKGRIKILKK